jgi:hypothetical protein
MGLIKLHDLIRAVLSCSHAATADGTSYFYQFILHADIRPYFKARLAGFRGRVAEVMMKRMPMGWSWAPRIAQHVSNVLTRGVGVAWLDDFFIGGKNIDEFNSNRELFQQRVRRYNVQLDDDTLTPSTQIEMVGLEFDLVDRRYRLQEKWVRQENFTDIDLRHPTSVRNWCRLFGALVWADHAAASPLWKRAECLAAISHLAKLGYLDFEQITTLPDYCLGNLEEWITDVLRNPWRSAPATAPTTPTAFFFSDASGAASAWARVSRDEVMTHAEQWGTDDDS